MHSIELKFGTHIIGHHRMKFCEFRIYSFLQEFKKELLYILVYGIVQVSAYAVTQLYDFKILKKGTIK